MTTSREQQLRGPKHPNCDGPAVKSRNNHYQSVGVVSRLALPAVLAGVVAASPDGVAPVALFLVSPALTVVPSLVATGLVHQTRETPQPRIVA
ncbi:MAG: hypothetical protein V5A25_05135 [Halovenus sp.]